MGDDSQLWIACTSRVANSEQFPNFLNVRAPPSLRRKASCLRRLEADSERAAGMRKSSEVRKHRHGMWRDSAVSYSLSVNDLPDSTTLPYRRARENGKQIARRDTLRAKLV